MFRNYLKIAIRNLIRNKVFSIINITGLGLGVAAFIFIFQYITFEESINKFHANLPNLYRILFEDKTSPKQSTSESITSGLAPRLKDQFGEIIIFCRVISGSMTEGVVSVIDPKSNQLMQPFREKNLAYAETSFFEMFSFPLLQGKMDCIKNPNSVAISESYGRKYFNKENPVGKTLVLNNQFGKTIYNVNAVYKDFPKNSDLQYDIIFSLETLKNPANLNGNSWLEIDGLNSQFITAYLQLKNEVEYKNLDKKLNIFFKKILPQAPEVLHLQPLSEVHLAASLNNYYTTTGNLAFVYLMAGVAMIILIIAWFNYINLSTAASLKRIKEVGVRKVIGATKNQLIIQFLGESILLNICGLLIGILLVMSFQPFYNYLIEKPLSFGIFRENNFWLFGVSLLLIGSLASGSYTAFVLSSYKPAKILKGGFTKVGKPVLLREFLVVFQFSLSIILIVCTFVLFRQLKFMQNKNLSMKMEQVLVIKGATIGRDSTFNKKNDFFLNQLKSLSFVRQLSNSGTVPGNFYNWGTVGITSLNPKPGDEKKAYNIALIDENYFSTFNLKFLCGKDFSPQLCEVNWDAIDKVIINETTALNLGFEKPEQALGQKIKWGNEREIIGVVKDYHHQGVRKSIEPILFMPRHNGGYYAIRLNIDQVQSNMHELEKLYKSNFPGNPYEYFFADENYNNQYKTEIQYGNIFAIASSLAIVIACLGLFGLAMFSVEQKTKEIGIRKVLGATVSQVVSLLSKEFLKLVLIAFIIAVPIAWFAMNKWLQDFAYRTEMSWWIFAIAGIIAFLIALLTVSIQAIKAAMANPVKSLRSE